MRIYKETWVFLIVLTALMFIGAIMLVSKPEKSGSEYSYSWIRQGERCLVLEHEERNGSSFQLSDGSRMELGSVHISGKQPEECETIIPHPKEWKGPGEVKIEK